MASLIRHARLAEVESARRALEDGWLAEVGALQKKVAASDAARARAQAEALGARQQLDAYEARVKQLEEEAMAAGLSVSPFTPPPLLPVSSGAVPGAIGTESAGGHRFDQSLGIASVIASSPFIHGGTGSGTGGGKGSGAAEEDDLGARLAKLKQRQASGEKLSPDELAELRRLEAQLTKLLKGKKGGVGGGVGVGTGGTGGTGGYATSSDMAPNMAPHFNHRKAATHQSLSFGSLTIDLSKTQPMSITFLFRTISQLVQCKLEADERALLSGKLPLSMTDYVCLQMISLYGAGKMAARYLQVSDTDDR